MINHWLKKIRILSLALGALSGVDAAASEISIVGTGDGIDVLRAIGDLYQKANPENRILVPPSIGSGGAIAAIGASREIVGRVARPLTPAEEASGIVYHPVFRVPTAFYVHPELKLRALTVEQLKGIFSGVHTSWSELGGDSLRIRVVRREDADSSIAVLRATLPAFRDIRFTERSKLAQTTQEAIDSVRQNVGAIGFGPYSVSAARELGVVRLDGLHPDDENYPSFVTIALIYRRDRLDAISRHFIEFFGSENARKLIVELGARPVGP